MGLVFGRVTNATFTIFLAFILSYAMLISLGLFAPDVLNALVQWAKTVETWITGTGLPARYNVWLDLFVEEGAILLLFFTVLARLIIAIIGSSFSSAIKSR
ncbi:hypothetical protein GCM10011367_02840 [Marinicauda pacifica]|jgi:hypothetical protein|uniref:DUF2523 domain-containing protein n=1 Tax=Marinicauda pacifica TaxID=1133559 RepID=A0A4S2HDP6_9PROT|nr:MULTISPECIES: hypothetical protein [Marinicauda]TGY93973.1 hypothetical protein E5162_01405 [Marinicauda pacifica]GGE31840.1 hypothetical protein GCM10011367_02840 [Marinicauda pacifica]